jgi:hypothetical protein
MPTDAGLELAALGALAVPANTLIKRVSDAIGGIARPWHTVRVAKAEAKASLIKASADSEVADLAARTQNRILIEEAKRQKNIENILEYAIPSLKADAKPELIEEDWITYFFEPARLISDDDVQQIWGSLLAEESNAPGTFSKRVINTLSVLDKKDAVTFSKLCNFVWLFEGEASIVVPDQRVLKEIGLDTMLQRTFDRLGLIMLSHGPFNAPFTRTYNGDITATARYFDQTYRIQILQKDPVLELGHFIFGDVGLSLRKLCVPEHLGQDYVDSALTVWRKRGHLLARTDEGSSG